LKAGRHRAAVAVGSFGAIAEVGSFD